MPVRRLPATLARPVPDRQPSREGNGPGQLLTMAPLAANPAPGAGRTPTHWQRWAARGTSAGLGGVLALAFPAPGLWWWAWVGLAPLLVVVARAHSTTEALVRTWLAAIGFVAVGHHWLTGALGVFMVPAVALVATLWLPFGAVAHVVLGDTNRNRRGVLAVAILPAVWVLTEVVRSVPVLAGTWGILGLTQAPVPGVLGVAALGGVWLLSAVLVATNTALAVCVMHLVGDNRRPGRAAGAALAAAALVGLSLSTGVFLAEPDGNRVVRVTGVQPGVVDDGGARLDANLALTNTIAPGSADVIVWGQSSVAFDLDIDTDVTRRLETTADQLGTNLLVNTDARSPEGRITKTSVLIRPGAGASQRYAKQRLVPFGEYIPARPIFGWVERFTDAADEDRLPGAGVVVMDLDAGRVGPLVSYESTFPDLRRAVTAAGADVVVVQAASTTFQGSWAQPQQAWGEAVRAAESGRATVMVAVSGTSAAFDARGRRLAWLPASDTGTFDVALPVASATTPYVRFGDWVVALAVVVVAVTAAVTLTRRLRRRRGSALPGVHVA